MARKPSSKPQSKAASRSGGRPPTTDTTSLLEWIAGGIGLVLLLLVVLVIGQEAVLGERSPPAIVVEQAGVQPTAGGYLVKIRVTNKGGATASQVVIEGELSRPGAEPETSEATFDYVPDKSSREGGLFFQGDPAGGALTLRAKGYVDP